MKLHLLTTTFLINCFVIVLDTFSFDKEEAALYLQKFGYLEDSIGPRKNGAILDTDSLSSAIKDFQRFAGLKQTGELDNDTVKMMNAPRCGVKDKIGRSYSLRRKRYALQGSKWRATQLSYRIAKYPTSFLDKNKVDKEIARAFKIWSDASTINFQERKSGKVNIDISFENGEHGDGDPFDGEGKSLAHAFFPQYGGDVHFDDEEKWTIEESKGTNIFQVAAHEFGHSLGLSHTNEKGALMAPFYTGYEPSFSLHSDDIQAIQSLYALYLMTSYLLKNNDFEKLIIWLILLWNFPLVGSQDQSPPQADEPLGPPQDTSDAPDLCQDATIDTITRTQNGNTYVFKGDFYWRTLPDGGIADGYPRKITGDWGGLEGNLDASLTWSTGKTFFFKGEQYWRFTNKKMDNGYPKFMHRGFEGIPDMLDAACVWSGNGKSYFFKGNQYWRYDINEDPSVDKMYPIHINNWKGLPLDGIDAAIQWENSRTYFFKGDKYYRFNDITSQVDPEYPLSTSEYWFGCKSESASR